MKSRRQFLQKVTLSAAALPFLSSFTPHERQSVSQEQPYEGPVLRVALMGLGGYANIVAKAMQSSKKAKVVGVISGTPSKIKDWQEKYSIPEKNCYNYETYHQIKDNPDIDIVYVVLPNSMHAEFTIRAAKAGKHVISEKPMAVTVEDCDKMIAACNEAGKKSAALIRETIKTQGSANIILATGSSQFETLKQLILEKGIEWNKVTMFHLDEYIGLPLSHKASFIFERKIFRQSARSEIG